MGNLQGEDAALPAEEKGKEEESNEMHFGV